jgi:hypothetical protein
MPSDANAPPVSKRPLRGRVAQWLDVLSRGAAPPGLIDIVHTRHAHLHRRFTMIASYGSRPARWSAMGLVVSALLGGVARPGAVGGQDAPPAPVGAAQPAAADAPPAAAAPSRPAARAVSAAPAPASPGIDARGATELWDKYAKQIFYVNGEPQNQREKEREYLEELRALAGSDAALDRLLREVVVRLKDKPGTYPRPTAPPAPSDDGALPSGVSDEDVDQALLATLDRKLPEVSFSGAPISEVIDFLRDVSGANLVVEWRVLESAGIDRNAPVTLRAKNVKFGRVLDLVLSGVAGGTVPLGYSVDDNIIRVSTGEDLDRVTDVRAYDVRDIVPAELPMDDLAKMIVETVAPDSWKDNGGSVGMLRQSKHKLVVTQTPTNPRQIRSVLKMLREQPHDAGATGAAAADAGQPAGPRP